jgi:uncharacterized protein YoxC
MAHDKLDLILEAIYDVKKSVQDLSRSVRALELKQGFLGEQVASHDAKIERLITDVKTLEKKVDEGTKDDKTRGRMAQAWFESVETFAEFLHALPTYWHLIVSFFLLIPAVWALIREHLKNLKGP